MRNALIFNAVIICVVSLMIIPLKGKQTRRERDEMEAGRVELVAEVSTGSDEQSKQA
jgi:hypothetical protein